MNKHVSSRADVLSAKSGTTEATQARMTRGITVKCGVNKGLSSKDPSAVLSREHVLRASNSQGGPPATLAEAMCRVNCPDSINVAKNDTV